MKCLLAVPISFMGEKYPIQNVIRILHEAEIVSVFHLKHGYASWEEQIAGSRESPALTISSCITFMAVVDCASRF